RIREMRAWDRAQPRSPPDRMRARPTAASYCTGPLLPCPYSGAVPNHLPADGSAVRRGVSQNAAPSRWRGSPVVEWVVDSTTIKGQDALDPGLRSRLLMFASVEHGVH